MSSANVSMRLCGIHIPCERYSSEKTAANRIHNTATNAEASGLLGYDNFDIAAMLNATVRDATGIEEAVQEQREARLDSIVAKAMGLTEAVPPYTFVDVTGSPIDVATVGQELDTLSVDLAKIAGVARSTLASTEGQARWPNLTPNINGRVLSISGGIETLSAMSQTFKTLSATVVEPA